MRRVHNKNLKSRLIIGDLLVCKTGNTIGKIGIVDMNFKVIQPPQLEKLLLILVDMLHFVKYVFQSNVIQKLILMTGIEKSCQPGFNKTKTESFVFTSLSEQTKIVSFLDTKTQKIDELIEKTEQKIKLLKEKRTPYQSLCDQRIEF